MNQKYIDAANNVIAKMGDYMNCPEWDNKGPEWEAFMLACREFDATCPPDHAFVGLVRDCIVHPYLSDSTSDDFDNLCDDFVRSMGGDNE